MEQSSDSRITWLTAARPAKYLLYVLGVVWIWLWVALGYPPVLQFLLNALLVVGFVVLRYGAALWNEHAAERKERYQRQSKDKRDFLLLLGGLTILIAVTTIPNNPQTGVILCIALVLVGTGRRPSPLLGKTLRVGARSTLPGEAVRELFSQSRGAC